MQDFRHYFKGKKITVIGLGLLGRGVGDTAFLAECGADIIVTDLKNETELAESFNRLKGFSNITFTLGEHREEDFRGRDMILKSAGVPLDSKFIAIARADGAEIKMSAALFAKLSGIPVIGVTGTRGKSTVTHMIHHVLSQATLGAPVLLGGNVRGVSNLQLLNDVHEDSVAVMELDSWQLQGFGDMEISPHVSVFTNLMEDHMNYYRKGDLSAQAGMEAYFADKANIFRYQDQGGVFVTTQAVFDLATEFMKARGEDLLQDVRLVDSSMLPEDCLLSMPGEHNRLNAALATEALRATGLTDEEIFAGLATFPGVPGRLEYLGEKNGVRIYNDNSSTTPAATIAGMQGVGNKERQNIVLIIGGDDKNIDMSQMTAEIPRWCSKVVMFKERGTDQIRDNVFAFERDGLRVYEEEGLEATVQRAIEIAEPGEVVLYSPGFSSFGKYFKNEFDRGDQFVNLITTYTNNES